MFANLEDVQKFGKDQFEVATAAAASVTRGVQEITAEVTEYSKKSMEDSSAMIEKLIGAKTLETAFQIQSEYARSAYEVWIAKAARFGEIYAGLAKEAFRPVEAALTKAGVPAR